jgi:NADH-quinone oxidoreductase subunit H
VFVLMWIRGTWPRFRIDQMLGFAWKVLVPASLVNLLWAAVILKVAPDFWPRSLLLMVGNVALIVLVLGLLGRAARRFALDVDRRRLAMLNAPVVEAL